MAEDASSVKEELLELSWVDLKKVLSAEKNPDVILATLNARLKRGAPEAETATVPIDLFLAASKKDTPISMERVTEIYTTVAKQLGELGDFNDQAGAMRFTLMYSFGNALAVLYNQWSRYDK